MLKEEAEACDNNHKACNNALVRETKDMKVDDSMTTLQ